MLTDDVNAGNLRYEVLGNGEGKVVQLRKI